MSSHQRFGLYVCRIGDIVVEQCDSHMLSTNNRKTEVVPGGLLTRKAVINAVTDPEIIVATRDLVGLFSGSSDVDISAGYLADTTASLTAASLFQGQRRVDAGTFEGTGQSKHWVATVNRSFTIVDELRAEQDSGGGVVATLRNYPLSTDGQTAPITYTAIGTLTGTPDYSTVFYMGPVWYDIGGTEAQLLGVQSVSVRPGLRVHCKRADGDAYPHKCAIVEVAPEIRIVTSDLESFYTRAGGLGLFGKANSIGISCYFQKGVDGGARVAKATAEHIRIDAATSDLTADSIGFEGLEDGSVALTIRPKEALALTDDVAIYVDP